MNQYLMADVHSAPDTSCVKGVHDVLLLGTYRKPEGISDCLCYSRARQHRWHVEGSMRSSQKDRKDAIEVLWQFSVNITVDQGLHIQCHFQVHIPVHTD